MEVIAIIKLPYLNGEEFATVLEFFVEAIVLTGIADRDDIGYGLYQDTLLISKKLHYHGHLH